MFGLRSLFGHLDNLILCTCACYDALQAVSDSRTNSKDTDVEVRSILGRPSIDCFVFQQRLM